jgi:hypothetical protein
MPRSRASRDIEEDQLVRPLALIGQGRLHGVTRIHEVNEIDPLDHAAPVHIETGNDTDGEHLRRAELWNAE